MGELRYVSKATGETVELDGPVTATDAALAIRGTLGDMSLGFRSVEYWTSPADSFKVDAAFTDKGELDRIVSIIDADKHAKTPGTLYAAGCEQRGFIAGIEPKRISPSSVEGSMTIALLDGAWYKPRLIHMFPGSGEGEGTKKYPYKRPYRYASEFGIRAVGVSCKVPVNFLMCIFGYARNPKVKIGSNVYEVDVTVPVGGYLLLDSRDCTGTLVGPDGAKTNVFHECRRGTGVGCGTYAWERIPAGMSNATWNDTFGFDLTLFEESSSPPFGGA